MLPDRQNTPFSPALQTVISRTLDPSHGFFTELREERPPVQTASLRVVRAFLAPPAYFRANTPSPVKTAEDGCGAAFDRETAYWSAIGEAVERYAASIYWPEDLTTAIALELPDALPLLPLIGVARPETNRFSPDTPYKWVNGIDLATGMPVSIPASMIYLGYRPDLSREILVQSDSTGLACGQSFEDACLRALCEVIERDAFAANWLLNRQPPRLELSEADMATLPQPVQAALTDRAAPVSVLHVTKSYGVHVVLAFIQGERGLSSVGAAASPYLGTAVAKATIEALQGWHAVSSMAIIKEPLSIDALETPFDHLRYYLHPDRQPILRDAFGSTETVSFSRLSADDTGLSAVDIAGLLAHDSFSTAAFDLTTADVAQLGFKVARIVVPGMEPLVFGPYCTTVVDDRRLMSWRKAWNLCQAPYNPNPHPFP